MMTVKSTYINLQAKVTLQICSTTCNVKKGESPLLKVWHSKTTHKCFATHCLPAIVLYVVLPALMLYNNIKCQAAVKAEICKIYIIMRLQIHDKAEP